MSNNHYEKWLFKTPVGLLLIAGGVFFIYYSLIKLNFRENWVLYGLISSLSISIGAFLLKGAAVHKVKSDLIKKQKNRQQL